jgi:peptidoglycan hydrolase CwlO-like protein
MVKRLTNALVVVSLVFGSAFFAAVTSAHATPAEDLAAAQAALAAGQQEVTDATAAKATADARVVGASAAVLAAQAAMDEAQHNYDTQPIVTVTAAGSGLAVDIYNNIISRTPEAWQLCRHTTVSQISAQWGGGSVMGCNPDWVTVHYYGTLTVPATMSYQFRNIADDGFYMTLDGQLVINDWRDKGCGGNMSAPITLQAGHAYVLDAWYYENGGGACSTLYSTGPNGYNVVPASWFGQAPTTVSTPDPALLAILQQKQVEMAQANEALDAAMAAQLEAQTRLDSANAAIPALQKAVDDAQAALDAEVARIAAEQAAAAQAAADAEAARLAAEQAAQPQPSPSQTSVPEATPTPEATQPPVQETVDTRPVVEPTPVETPASTPAPSPTATPSETPTVEPTVAPTEAPTPVVTPTSAPTPDPVVPVPPTTSSTQTPTDTGTTSSIPTSS